MINIDFLTLRAFVKENSEYITEARVQKIQQPTRKDFIIFLRNHGESRKLYININPQIYHLSFMSKENEERRNLVIPKKPPMFCMLLRKYLEGAKIMEIKAVPNERILELYFESYDEISQKQILCLAVELMGKHSNVILYRKDNGIIIGCAHNVGAEKSRYRELQGGLRYIYPPTSSAGLSNELKKQFNGLDEKTINMYLTSETYRPALNDESYTLFSELIPNSVKQNSVNEMLDNYYALIQEKTIISNEKLYLREIAEKKLRKVKSTISKVSTLLKKRDNTDKYKLYGELITANIYKEEFNYKKEISVYDYNTDKIITIELDETKSLKENAQRYFKLYTKSKITKEKSEEMLKNLNAEREYYENILYSIEVSQKKKELEEIKEELVTTKIPDKKSPVIVEKMLISGYEVYIGKNNKQNDYIISKLAKDEDYWFHTKLCAGSHILLKVNGVEPKEEVIFECSKLARKYSSATQPSKIGVIYTKAKNLRKPPASPLGYVTYKNEKEILI